MAITINKNKLHISLNKLIAVIVLLASGIVIAEPHIPTTVSKEAQMFLKSATPADLSKPISTEEWKQLRAEMTSYYDSIDLLRKQYHFSMDEKELGGIKVLIFTPLQLSKYHQGKILLHIHGGAYVVGSPRVESAIIVPVAHFSGLKVVSVRYSLAPEYPFPKGLDYVLSVYRELLKEYSPDNIAIIGSSAGGGLALAAVLKARNERLPMPAALGLLSPWVDITKTGDSYYTLEGIAPVLDYELTLRKAAEVYAGNHDMRHPLISPVYADYEGGFPPTFIQIGTRDLLLSNCARLQRKMISADVKVKISLWDGMWHAFQMNPSLPEAKDALRELSDYLSSKLDANS